MTKKVISKIQTTTDNSVHAVNTKERQTKRLLSASFLAVVVVIEVMQSLLASFAFSLSLSSCEVAVS